MLHTEMSSTKQKSVTFAGSMSATLPDEEKANEFAAGRRRAGFEVEDPKLVDGTALWLVLYNPRPVK